MNKIAFPSENVQLLSPDGKTMAQDWVRFFQDLQRATGTAKEPVYADVFFSSTSMFRDESNPPGISAHNGVSMYSFPDGSTKTAHLAALVPENCADESPLEMVFKCVMSGSGSCVWRVRGQIEEETFDKNFTMAASSGIATGTLSIGVIHPGDIVVCSVERVGGSTADTFASAVLLVGVAFKFQCIGVGGL